MEGRPATRLGVMRDLPQNLQDAGFELFAPGIARRPVRHDFHASRKWEWFAQMQNGIWTNALSEKHARALVRKPIRKGILK